MQQALDALEKAMGDAAEFGRISYGQCLSACAALREELAKIDGVQMEYCDCPGFCTGACEPWDASDTAYRPGGLPQPEHWSDCALYNEPAYPAGECDCGGYKPPQDLPER